jgi:ferredoxin
VSGRNVMYVCQGAEFDIFDITTDALASSITQIDIVGKVFGAVQIDP